MAVKIYYQEDCNLALIGGQDNCCDRLRQPGTCTCFELKGVRMWMLSSDFMRAAVPGRKQRQQGFEVYTAAEAPRKLMSS